MVCRMCKATIEKKAENILQADPFEVLDQEGVGAMMKWAIQEGRKTRPGIKLVDLAIDVRFFLVAFPEER